MDPTLELAFNQIWTKAGVPQSTEVVAGKLFVGDAIRNTLTNDVYEITSLEPDANNWGQYNNITYQIRITSDNINQFLPSN